MFREPPQAPTGVGCCEMVSTVALCFLTLPETQQGWLPRLLRLHDQGSPSCQSPGSTPLLSPDSPSGKTQPQDPHRPPLRSAPAPACSSPPRSLAGPPPHINKFGRQFWLASSKATEAQRKAGLCPGLNLSTWGSDGEQGPVYKRSWSQTPFAWPPSQGQRVRPSIL